MCARLKYQIHHNVVVGAISQANPACEEGEVSTTKIGAKNRTWGVHDAQG